MKAPARRLGIQDICAMSEGECFDLFVEVRWPMGVECPKCGGDGPYFLAKRARWKCRKCYNQFSVTSGTPLASRKLSFKDQLFMLALYANAKKGISALQLSRETPCQYKAAFVFLHKVREAIEHAADNVNLDGVVEIDGAFFGGHLRNSNTVSGGRIKRVVKRHWENRKVVVVMRQRGGITIPIVVPKESAALGEVLRRVRPGAVIHTDQAHAWDSLSALFDLMRINHKVAFVANNACTNNAESYFAMLRRMQLGVHHRLSGRYLQRYAFELACRQNNRRASSAELLQILLKVVLSSGKSTDFAAYWQRSNMTKKNAATIQTQSHVAAIVPILQVIEGGRRKAA